MQKSPVPTGLLSQDELRINQKAQQAYFLN